MFPMVLSPLHTRRMLFAALSLLFCQATPGIARSIQAADVLVIGDSIGEGIAQINGLKSVAKRSVSLVRSNLMKDIGRLPKGTVGLLSLGVNDAAGPLSLLRGPIEKVITAVEGAGAAFVWVGPPCVLKRWDDHAKALDEYLQQRLATTSIRYIGLRDAEICKKGMRSNDGVHFTAGGYKFIWGKVQQVALTDEGKPAMDLPAQTVTVAALPDAGAASAAALPVAVPAVAEPTVAAVNQPIVLAHAGKAHKSSRQHGRKKSRRKAITVLTLASPVVSY